MEKEKKEGESDAETDVAAIAGAETGDPLKEGATLTTFEFRDNMSVTIHCMESFKGCILQKDDKAKGAQHIDKTGLLIWPATFLLCDFLCWCHRTRSQSDDSPLSTLSVVELGAGAGLSGFLTALLRPSFLLLTDRDADALSLLRHNARATSRRVGVERLSWGDNDDLANIRTTLEKETKRHHCDLVMAADVVYPNVDKIVVSLLFDTVSRLLPPSLETFDDIDEMIAKIQDPSSPHPLVNDQSLIATPSFVCSFVCRDRGRPSARRMMKAAFSRGFTAREIPWTLFTPKRPLMDAQILLFRRTLPIPLPSPIASLVNGIKGEKRRKEAEEEKEDEDETEEDEWFGLGKEEAKEMRRKSKEVFPDLWRPLPRSTIQIWRPPFDDCDDDEIACELFDGWVSSHPALSPSSSSSSSSSS